MTSWFTSTLQAVREKSIVALDFVRKDLSEFTTTVKDDTETYLKRIQSQPTDSFGINHLVSRSNVSSRSDENNGKHLATFDRFHNETLRLQNDESTYLTDPLPIEMYKTWCETSDFSIENRKGDITQLLIDCPHVRSVYARLVPTCTTHQEFWSRYYFRLHRIEEDETRRLKLLKRAQEICDANQADDWDEPDNEWAEETTTTSDDQRAIPNTTAILENVTTEQKEDRLISGGSWNGEFDKTDLEATLTSNTELPEINPSETSLSNEDSKIMKKTEDDLDDDWESWP